MACHDRRRAHSHGAARRDPRAARRDARALGRGEGRRMSWLERVSTVEELEVAPLDAALLAELEREGARSIGREIRFSTPTFKSYSSCDVGGCGKNAFPAFSIAAGAWGLAWGEC